MLITDVASGAKTSREGLDQMMQLVRRGKIDVIACFKLDRLGRSLPHLAQIIAELDQQWRRDRRNVTGDRYEPRFANRPPSDACPDGRG